MGPHAVQWITGTVNVTYEGLRRAVFVFARDCLDGASVFEVDPYDGDEVFGLQCDVCEQFYRVPWPAPPAVLDYLEAGFHEVVQDGSPSASHFDFGPPPPIPPVRPEEHRWN